MEVAIAGGSGFIGNKLTHLLISDGHEVVILTRQDKQALKTIS
ncbi:NAD-dependent epimerase/dehydratase family protein [Ureibacillus sp. GCM10028918]